MGRRTITTLLLALAMLPLGATVAWAGDCYVVNKPDDAGTLIEVVVTEESLEINGLTPTGRLRGGFYDFVYEGEVVANDIMLVSLHSMGPDDLYAEDPVIRGPMAKFDSATPQVFADRGFTPPGKASAFDIPVASGGFFSPKGKGVDLYGH